jgi:hypothetical protein
MSKKQQKQSYMLEAPVDVIFVILGMFKDHYKHVSKIAKTCHRLRNICLRYAPYRKLVIFFHLSAVDVRQNYDDSSMQMSPDDLKQVMFKTAVFSDNLITVKYIYKSRILKLRPDQQLDCLHIGFNESVRTLKINYINWFLNCIKYDPTDTIDIWSSNFAPMCRTGTLEYIKALLPIIINSKWYVKKLQVIWYNTCLSIDDKKIHYVYDIIKEKFGQSETIDLLINNELNNTHQIYHTFCKNGKYDLVKWFYKQRPAYNFCRQNYILFNNACDSGNLELVKWLYRRIQKSSGYPPRLNPDNVIKHTEIYSWLALQIDISSLPIPALFFNIRNSTTL